MSNAAMALRASWLALLLCAGGAVAQGAAAPAPAALPASASAADAATPAHHAEAADAAAMAATPATDAAPATPVVDPATRPPAYADELRARTREILASPDFRQRETMRYPAPRDWLRKLLQGKGTKPSATHMPDLSLLGTLFKYLALLVLALGLAWLLWRGWQWLAPQAARRGPGRGSAAADVRHLDLPDAPLPDAITGAARAAWQAGDATLALSLLYRGAVRDLAQRHRIELPDSATEGECLREARRSGAAVVAAGFAPIVQAWIALAYARRAPADFEALLALYARYFEPATGAPS